MIKNAFHRVDNLELVDNQNIFETGDKALYDTKHLHEQTGLPQFISNISSVLGRENGWIKTKGDRQTHSHDNRNYSQSKVDLQLKAIQFMTDRHSSQTTEGEEEEALKRFITPFKIIR